MYQVSVINMGMFDMLMFNAKLRTIVIASSPGITRRKDEERHRKYATSSPYDCGRKRVASEQRR
jgi:hypothetical protein